MQAESDDRRVLLAIAGPNWFRPTMDQRTLRRCHALQPSREAIPFRTTLRPGLQQPSVPSAANGIRLSCRAYEMRDQLYRGSTARLAQVDRSKAASWSQA